MRNAKSLAIAPKLYSFTVGVPSEDFRKALGKDADHAFGMTAWLPDASLKDRWFGDAEQFAKDSGAALGGIRSANQGVVTINDRDRGSPQTKTVRVVTTVEYFLK